MIVLIEGLAGSGKTWLMSRLVKKEWKRGQEIFPNFPMWFDEEKTRVKRWHNLDETYHLNNGVLCIDESQKFLDNRMWMLLPQAFKEKIAMHRHHHLMIYTTTQDMGQVDIRLRQNVHERFKCDSIFRFPKNQRHKPILQIIKVKRFMRSFEGELQRVKWSQFGFTHLKFISRYWTKTYYNTYGDVGEQKFICKIYQQRTAITKPMKWRATILSKELFDKGRRL